MKIKTLSVCFADQTNFRKLMKVAGEMETVKILQEVFMEVGDIIIENRGTIRKYIADAVLFTCEEPQQAIQAAQAIVDKVKRTEHGLELSFSVAVATGEVVVTDIGHPSFTMEDVFGETVNRAATLLGEAQKIGTHVALCPETQKYLA